MQAELRRNDVLRPCSTTIATMVACSAMVLGSAIRAEECPPQWLKGEGIPGLNAPVNALATWTLEDGTNLLVAGGEFVVAGDVHVSRIAAWNGVRWDATSARESTPPCRPWRSSRAS